MKKKTKKFKVVKKKKAKSLKGGAFRERTRKIKMPSSAREESGKRN